MNYPVKGLLLDANEVHCQGQEVFSQWPTLYMYVLKWSRQALNQTRDKINVKMGHAFLKKIMIEFTQRSSHSSCTLYLLYTFCYQTCASSVLLFIHF